MNIVIFGPPGAGKGTQSKFIVKKFNMYQLSTGEFLRKEITKNYSENDKKLLFSSNAEKEKIIEFFDKNNIFILPSYVEAYPQVILESLSRVKPIIIFNDIKYLKKIVKTHVIDILDHSQFDVEVSWFKNRQPSSENLVKYIWHQIEPRLKDAKLYRIRLHETPTIFTDYYGA